MRSVPPVLCLLALLLAGAYAGEPPSPPPAAPKAAAPAPKPATPQQVLAAFKQLVDRVRCSYCGGSGKISGQVEVGRRRVNKDMTRPILEERTRPCQTCSGLGLASTQVVRRYGGAFVAALDTAPADDPKWADVSAQLADRLRELCDLGLDKWRTRLNETALTKLNANAAPAGGEPFLIVGTLDSDVVAAGAPRRCEVGIGKMTVVMENVRIVNATTEDVVLIGGVLDRREVRGGNFVPVLRNGFVCAAR